MRTTDCEIFFKRILLGALLAMPLLTKAQHMIEYVDPFTGIGGHRHTYPASTVPFSMVELSPDNGSQSHNKK